MTIRDLIEYKINHDIDGVVFDNDKYPDHYFECYEKSQVFGYIVWEYVVRRKWKINYHTASIANFLTLHASGCNII